MAYKACFSCELLFEVDTGLGDSNRCPQCGGVISDYQPSQEELTGKAQDVAPAPTQATPAIVRTMSYKGLADAVREKIESRQSSPGRPVPRGRAAPRGRAPVARAAARPVVPARGSIPPSRPSIPPRGGLIPARPVAQPAPVTRARPNTAPLESLSGGELDAPVARRPETAPIGSINATAADLNDETALSPPAVPEPMPSRPVVPRPAVAAPVPAAAAAPVPVAVAAPVVPQVPAGDRPDGRQRTKVLDSVADEPALEASVIEDISMQSMVEDGSVLEDISMQSVVEDSGAAGGENFDLPATVGLQLDRPLPPMPAKAPPAPAKPAPVPASPVSPFAATAAAPQPVLPQIGGAPKPAPQPVAPQPVAPRPAAPQPAAPQPASPFGATAAAPQPAIPFGAPKPAGIQPAGIQPAGIQPAPGAPPVGMQPAPGQPGADAFAPVVMGSTKKKSKLPLIIALVVVLVAGLGFGVWYFVLRDGAVPPEPEKEAPPPPVLSWSEKLEQQVAAGQAPLPKVAAAAPLAESTWLAGGPEGMSTSLGLVTGMATSAIRQGAAQSDDEGDHLPAVKQKLAEGSPTAETVLLLGFPEKYTVAEFLLMADSGRRAGHGAFAMVVDQTDSPGTLGLLPFLLPPKGGPLPEKGAMVVRVGRTGLHVTARGADGKRLAEGGEEGAPPPDARVPRKGEALDLDGLLDRLVALGNVHPDIAQVRVHPIPDMTLGELSALMSRVYQGKDGKRFAETAIGR